MVVDICIGKNGYYTYERIIPKIQGIAVAVLAEWSGRFFLLKQYRHALRDWQYAIPRGFASAIDISNTKKVKEGAELLTIELFDHIIVGADATYCSLREQGNF